MHYLNLNADGSAVHIMNLLIQICSADGKAQSFFQSTLVDVLCHSGGKELDEIDEKTPFYDLGCKRSSAINDRTLLFHINHHESDGWIVKLRNKHNISCNEIRNQNVLDVKLQEEIER